VLVSQALFYILKRKATRRGSGPDVKINFSGVTGEALVKIDDTISAGVVLCLAAWTGYFVSLHSRNYARKGE